MTASDDEFEDFLKRRAPRFRAPDDMFEPPSELDRVILRQAREAIETPRPLQVFRGPRWAAPVALAATLVLAVGVVFYGGLPQERAPVPEVTVQNVAERFDSPLAPAANNQARAEADTSGPVIVELAAPPPAAAPVLARSAEASARAGAMADTTMESAAKTTAIPSWRHDAKTWLAEIERLRQAGDSAAADAELAEYRHQQRAFAAAPDH
jgi:hypothetical protein